jgi:hypothetical protein
MALAAQAKQEEKRKEKELEAQLFLLVKGTVLETVEKTIHDHEIVFDSTLMLKAPRSSPLNGQTILRAVAAQLEAIFQHNYSTAPKAKDPLLAVVNSAVRNKANDFVSLAPDEVAVKEQLIQDLFEEYFDEVFAKVIG